MNTSGEMAFNHFFKGSKKATPADLHVRLFKSAANTYKRFRMIDSKLFDPDPRVRWKTARELRQNNYLAIKSKIESDFRDWPNFWWGVVNPWVVFVGPSPGNRPGQSIDWKKEKMPTLGEANTIEDV